MEGKSRSSEPFVGLGSNELRAISKMLKGKQRLKGLEQLKDLVAKPKRNDEDGMLELVNNGLLKRVSKLAKDFEKSKPVSMKALHVAMFYIYSVVPESTSVFAKNSVLDGVIKADLPFNAYFAFKSDDWNIKHSAMCVLTALSSLEELVPTLLQLSSSTNITVVTGVLHILKEFAKDGAKRFHGLDLVIQDTVKSCVRFLRNLSYCDVAHPVLLQAGVVEMLFQFTEYNHPFQSAVRAGMCVANLVGSDPSKASLLANLDHSRPWSVVPRLVQKVKEASIVFNSAHSKEITEDLPENQQGSVRKADATDHEGRMSQLLYTVSNVTTVEQCRLPLVEAGALPLLESILQTTCQSEHKTFYREDDSLQQSITLSLLHLSLDTTPEMRTLFRKQEGLLELLNNCKTGTNVSSTVVVYNAYACLWHVQREEKEEKNQLFRTVVLAFHNNNSDAEVVGKIRQKLESKGMVVWVVPINDDKFEDKGRQEELRHQQLVEDSALVCVVATEEFNQSRQSRLFCQYACRLKKPILGFSGSSEADDDFCPAGWLGITLAEQELISICATSENMSIVERTLRNNPVFPPLPFNFKNEELPPDSLESDSIENELEGEEHPQLVKMFSEALKQYNPKNCLSRHSLQQKPDIWKQREATKEQLWKRFISMRFENPTAPKLDTHGLSAMLVKEFLLAEYFSEKLCNPQLQVDEATLDISKQVTDYLKPDIWQQREMLKEDLVTRFISMRFENPTLPKIETSDLNEDLVKDMLVAEFFSEKLCNPQLQVDEAKLNISHSVAEYRESIRPWDKEGTLKQEKALKNSSINALLTGDKLFLAKKGKEKPPYNLQEIVDISPSEKDTGFNLSIRRTGDHTVVKKLHVTNHTHTHL